jgi:hypothetical protein
MPELTNAEDWEIRNAIETVYEGTKREIESEYIRMGGGVSLQQYLNFQRLVDLENAHTKLFHTEYIDYGAPIRLKAIGNASKSFEDIP